MNDSPAALLVDVSGTFMAVTSSLQIRSAQPGLITAGVGSDGVVRFNNVDSNSALKTTGSVNISNSSLNVTGTVALTGTGSIIVTSHPAITGTVALTGTGSVIITSLPNITGSVNVTNTSLNVTGSVGISNGINVISHPAITGTVALTGTGSVIVTSLPNITGSVNVTNTLFNVTGAVGVGNVVTVTGSVALSQTASVFINVHPDVATIPVTVGNSITLANGISPANVLYVSPGVGSIFRVTGNLNLNDNFIAVRGIDASGSTMTVAPIVMAGSNASNQVSVPLVDAARSLLITGTVSVKGPAAVGASISTNPVLIAGSNSSGLVTIPQVDKILGQTVNQVSVASTITSPGAAARGAYAFVNAYGSLRVSPESTALFNETFDGFTLDANRWISSGSGAAAGVTIGGGSASISAGAGANSFAYLQSVPTFNAYGTTFEIYGAVATFFGDTTNCLQFLGIGTPRSTPTTTLPLFDGVGFENDITGTLTAVVYASGSLAYKSAPLLPAPGLLPGRYGFHLRSDLVLFYYPGSEYPVASVNFTGSYIQQLPILNLAVNHSVAPSTTSGLRVQNQSINDSGKNSVAIGDATYPWRKATVNASGNLGVFLANPENNVYAATSVQTPAATPTDIFTLAGSATKTVRVTRINLTSTQNTAGTNQIFIVKRSTADSGGTSTTPGIVPFDSASPAATAVMRSYSANPTTGSAVGTIYALKLFSPTLTTSPALSRLEIDLTNGSIHKGVVLRGTAQQLAINFNGVALPAGLNINAGFEWVEE